MPTVRDRVTLQFPSLFITLVSVLMGLILADIASEAHARMMLWPLTVDTLLTWAQIVSIVISSIAVWIVYSHIGIVRQSVATMSDTFVAFLTPAPMLIMTGLTGRAESWPWFYGGGVYLVFAAFTTLWQNRLAVKEKELAPFRRLTRPAGALIILYVGIPGFLFLGWLDQNGMLSPVLRVLAASLPTPMAFLFCTLFMRDWRRAIAEASVAAEAKPQP